MQPNEYGVIVENKWVKTAEIRPNVIIDKYIICIANRRFPVLHSIHRNADVTKNVT